MILKLYGPARQAAGDALPRWLVIGGPRDESSHKSVGLLNTPPTGYSQPRDARKRATQRIYNVHQLDDRL
jgi:hypothetical protein